MKTILSLQIFYLLPFLTYFIGVTCKKKTLLKTSKLFLILNVLVTTLLILSIYWKVNISIILAVFSFIVFLYKAYDCKYEEVKSKVVENTVLRILVLLSILSFLVLINYYLFIHLGIKAIETSDKQTLGNLVNEITMSKSQALNLPVIGILNLLLIASSILQNIGVGIIYVFEKLSVTKSKNS